MNTKFKAIALTLEIKLQPTAKETDALITRPFELSLQFKPMASQLSLPVTIKPTANKIIFFLKRQDCKKQLGTMVTELAITQKTPQSNVDWR